MTTARPRRRTALVPRDIWATAAVGWVIARLLVGLGVLIAHRLDADGRFDERSRLGDGLLAWDGGWYRLIAADGYRAGGEEVRFAPLYPALGRAAGLVAGDQPEWGLVAVSNVAALVAAAAMIAYVRQRRDDTGLTNPRESLRMERLVGLSLALWPAGFVLVFAYAESLLLALTTLAALAARQRRWGTAAVLGLLAGAVRPTGMALVFFLAVVVWGERRRGATPFLAPVAVLAPVLGFALHLGSVWAWGSSWRSPVDVQQPLRGAVVDPFRRIATGVADLAGNDPWGDGLHLPFAIAAIVVAVLVFRHLGLGEGLMSAAVVLVALSAENWNSLERYVGNAFPMFVVAAFVLRGRAATVVLVGGGMSMVALTVLTLSGRYVP